MEQGGRSGRLGGDRAPGDLILAIDPLAGLGAGSSSGSAASGSLSKSKKDAGSIEQEILDKGFAGWLKETQEEKLKEEIRKRVMASVNLTDEQLAAMPKPQQASIEKRIDDEVARQFKLAIENANDPTQQKAGEKGDSQGQSAGGQSDGPGPKIPFLAAVSIVA